jgi:NADP-dependent 3-hydroxy acid dehydrogenase YdfG
MSEDTSRERPLVVITGASSGIGAATARAMSAAGYPLLLLARRIERLEALALPWTICRAVDVTDPDAAAAALTDAEAAFGPAEHLINNAGLMPLGEVATQDAAEWQRMFDVNCVALLNVTRLVLPAMIARRSGTIVNLGSIAGRNLYSNHVVYNGTKFAVHAMSEGLRKEVAGSNVRVVLVAPGMVETELLDATRSAAVRQDYLDYKASIGGALPAEVIADTIRYVCELPQSVCVREIVVAPTTQDA